MSRQPWSMPTRTELWHVLIGMIVGFLVALALTNLSGRQLVVSIFLFVITVVPFTVVLVNCVSGLHEENLERRERQRKLAEEIYWLKDANRAATNKPRGLIWMGRHPRRR